MFKTSSSVIIVADSHEPYLIIARIDAHPTQGAVCFLTFLSSNSIAKVALTDKISDHAEIPEFLRTRSVEMGFRNAPRLLERLEKIENENDVDFEQKIVARWHYIKQNAKIIREGTPWQN